MAEDILAAGTDGAFAGGTWQLTSTSVDFGAAGIAPGHVVQLSGGTPPLKGSGRLLAVDSAAGHTLNLRLPGRLSGVGAPPAAATGMKFTIATLDPVIEEASYDLEQRFGIDDQVPEDASAMLYRARELRQVTVSTVMAWRFPNMSRQPDDYFARRAKEATDELAGRLARTSVHWTRRIDQEVTGRFSTRLVR